VAAEETTKFKRGVPGLQRKQKKVSQIGGEKRLEEEKGEIGEKQEKRGKGRGKMLNPGMHPGGASCKNGGEEKCSQNVDDLT